MFIDSLPNEIKCNVLELLEIADFPAITLLNSKWNQLFHTSRKRLRRAPADEMNFCDAGDGQIQVQIVLKGDPEWTKRTLSRTVLVEKVFDLVWPYSPKEIHINSYSTSMKRAFETIPDYWLQQIEKMEIFEEEGNEEVSELFNHRFPSLQSVSIDPCFSAVQSTSLVQQMPAIREIKLRSSNQRVQVGDSTLEEIIEKSQKDKAGLRTFWIDTEPASFSMSMVERFLQEANFADRCSLFFPKVRGSFEFQFRAFLERNFEVLNHCGTAFTFRTPKFSDLTVIIESFER